MRVVHTHGEDALITPSERGRGRRGDRHRQAGKPVARLLPFEPRRQPRQPDLLKGQIWIAEDFDDPLPEAIMAKFRGECP
jgi:hypothetical protein